MGKTEHWHRFGFNVNHVTDKPDIHEGDVALTNLGFFSISNVAIFLHNFYIIFLFCSFFFITEVKMVYFRHFFEGCPSHP